jgi:hypothetical protein
LLVVIVIIVILVGLLAAAVFGALTKAKQVRNRAEISQLEIGVNAFKTKYGGVNPPSRLKLCENFTSYDLTTPNQLDVDSVAFIQKVWPRINWANPAGGIDWNGNGVIDTATKPPGRDGGDSFTLEGDQVLVFCLGGIPNNLGAIGTTPPSTLGFSSDPTNPANFLSPNPQPPLFEFATSRLVRIPRSYNPANLFFSYLDNYGTTDGLGGFVSGSPYLYFSSYKVANGYNRYLGFAQPPYLTGNGLLFPLSDCFTASGYYASNSGSQAYANAYATYPLSVSGSWPFQQSAAPSASLPPVFLNPNSYQIISAGADQFFGSGSVPGISAFWTPANAGTMNPLGTPGYDDQSNFTGALLGVGKD